MSTAYEPTVPPETAMAQEILSMALRHARDAELFWASEEAVTAGHVDGRARGTTRREGEGVALRVISSGRVGFAVHIGPVLKAEPLALLKEATRQAAEGPEAPATFCKEREAVAAVQTWDDNVAALSPQDLARIAAQASARVADLVGAAPRDVAVRRVIRRMALITRTAEKRSEKSIFQFRAQVGPLAGGAAVLSDTWASCRFPEDPMACLADLTWKAALARDAVRFEPGVADVVLSPRAVATVLRWACAALTGRAFIDGTSPLLGGSGKRVFDERISLADDATQAWVPGAARYDGEGVPRQRHVLIDKGILQGLLLDLASAWKIGMEPSGSAVRSMDAPPLAAPAHLELSPGDSGFDDLLAGCEGGLYVDALADDVEPDVAGNFRVPVRAAFHIRGGRPSGWVDGVAWEGNVFEMLSDHVAAVGSDRVTGIGARCGSMALREVQLVRA